MLLADSLIVALFQTPLTGKKTFIQPCTFIQASVDRIVPYPCCTSGGSGSAAGRVPSPGSQILANVKMMRQPTASGASMLQGTRPISRGTVHQAVTGTAAVTEVALRSRPLTTHGMGGPQAVTGQRLVYDLAYFISDLRNRIVMTGKEADALSVNTAELHKRESQAEHLESVVASIKEEVERNQGDLHDLTYAQTRLKDGASLEDLRAEAQQAEADAARLRNEADVAFRARSDAEGRLEKAESNAAKMRADAESKIEGQLGQKAADEYRALLDENAKLKKAESDLRARLQEASAVAASAYSAMSVLSTYDASSAASSAAPSMAQSSNVQKAVTVHRQICAVRRELEQLRQTAAKSEASDPDFSVKQQLRTTLRVEHAEARGLADELKALVGNIAQRRKILAEVTPDMVATISREQRELLKSILKADQFLAAWPQIRQGLQSSNKQLQDAILATAARLPAKQQRPERATPADGADASLGEQLQTRTRELNHTSELEGKVTIELRDLDAKIENNRAMLQTITEGLADIESGDTSEATATALQERLQEQTQRLAELHTALEEAQAGKAQVEREAEGENVQLVRSLLGQLAATLHKKYQAEAYIKQRTAESNYSKHKAECQDTLARIEKLLTSASD